MSSVKSELKNGFRAGMATGLSKSWPSEVNWFFAKKAEDGETVTSFQWGLYLKEVKFQECTF